MDKLKLVDAYILKNEQWAKEMELLRETILFAGFTETLKWSAPVYTHSGKNILGLGSFKKHFGIWFFNGSLLNDSQNKFQIVSPEKTSAMRQWRFTSFEELIDSLEILVTYLEEAKTKLETEKMASPRISKPLIVPDILVDAIRKDVILKEAFDALNLTKKREYVAHIRSAKRRETKANRLIKMIPLIKMGVGLHDKYRK